MKFLPDKFNIEFSAWKMYMLTFCDYDSYLCHIKDRIEDILEKKTYVVLIQFKDQKLFDKDSKIKETNMFNWVVKNVNGQNVFKQKISTDLL